MTLRSPVDIPPLSSAMSELDNLSDSDWLDISSGKDSDDNDSLSDQDSDRDEISSLPRSRRSSISNEDSMSSDVEAWEGFVSDAGEDLVIGLIPDTVDAVDPAIAEEEKRVREALDQSFVGTLSASRSSTGAASSVHATSTHTSIRDLRLSFPDPLTSSRNDLNRSYESVSSPVESSVTSLANSDPNIPEFAPSPVGLPLLEDPGMFTTPAVQIQRHEVAPHTEAKGTDKLEIVLYGTSSEIKWKFLQDLIKKAAKTSGHVLVDSLRENAQTQRLRLIKNTEGFTPFYNVINARDLTTEAAATAETDDFDSRSLAIVYLPTPQLPILSWHSSYLPVLVPSLPDFDKDAILQAAEDDWDLLGVPANKTLKLGFSKSTVLDADELVHIDSTHVYEVLHNIGNDTKKITSLRPLTEHVKSMNAVTLFALMSIIMGFAFNTSFWSSTPSPTPTVNGPLSTNGHVWSFFAPQPNRSILAPSTPLRNTKSGASGSSPSLKDMAVSVFNPGSTSLVTTLPVSSKSLSVAASSSKAVAEMTTTSPIAKCQHCDTKLGSSADKSLTSTDVVLRSAMPTSLSATRRPSSSVIPHGSASAILLAGASIPKSTVATVASAAASLKFNSVSDVLDATTKALANDLTELALAADDLLITLREKRDNVIRQSKGKARAFGDQIQNLNEEVVYRNERAKKRARDLKKKGEERAKDWKKKGEEHTKEWKKKSEERAWALKKKGAELMREARKEFEGRTARAKQNAHALKKTVVDTGTKAWKAYEQAQDAWEEAFADESSNHRHYTENTWDAAQGCEMEKHSSRRANRKMRKNGRIICH